MALRAMKTAPKPTTAKAAKPSKGMKAMKAKRVVKKRKRVSVIAKVSDYKRKGWAYRLVWNGKKTKTSGGLKSSDLACNKKGRIVSGKKMRKGQQSYRNNNIDLWTESLIEARRASAVTGFVCPRRQGGREAQRDLYKKTLEGFVAKNVQRLNNTLLSSKQPEKLAEDKVEVKAEPAASPAKM